ncbi:ribosome-associated ATPase/putative transporter RbbA [Aquisphaera insulae]|uniref:ribosome-associated ATPase/putative transporter RbbA n=1 Tax=Aquisphaera insulae TaxID=2712864 RepID=UPI0013ED62F4|nr:ribosome-associated ATPase/putative transporter RbbA [Aquisphaera insulae]
MSASDAAVVSIRGLTQRYGKTLAVDGLDLDIPAGRMVGLIGPDGVGKSTLMGVIAGSRKIQTGSVNVLGGEMADSRHRARVCPRIAYMPQGLGKNLYGELSVFENIDFFARLFGQSKGERVDRIANLLKSTGLDPFPDRPAGKLSGGMKQKVSLCCSLVHDPDLLILDEPTTGVDPLSRQQFWDLIDRVRESRPGMSVLVSTAYMDEAQRFAWTIAMDAGHVLETGTPAELQERTGTEDLEAAFVRLLPPEKRGADRKLVIPPRVDPAGPPAITAKGLTKRFGSFTAVDHVSFEIARGEIFGFLGSNGCGKSTTMKMLTGLLPPTEGEAKLFGEAVEAGSIAIRNRVGYMSQAFSLYGELTVRENLVLHARLYHLPHETRGPRIDELVRRFGLGPYLDHDSEGLPLGLRQRLSLAVAVLHQPEMLILDEPTSGVDPVARDEFWEMLIDLSRKDGITIFVSTHFMNEAMRCDRISLMHAGKVLACDAPRALIDARKAPDLETAFIAYIAEAIGQAEVKEEAREATAFGTSDASDGHGRETSIGIVNPNRLLAYAHREMLEIVRDPVRLAFAFVGSALLMLIFGYGITTDVENIRFAAFDGDRTPASRGYVEAFGAPRRSFRELEPISSPDSANERLRANDISMALEIPPGFGRNIERGQNFGASILVDGANPFRAETIKQYAEGVNQVYYTDQIRQRRGDVPYSFASDIRTRFTYNPTFESVYAIVPSVPALLLILIPAVLMAVSVVREKELGTMINFYVTPSSRLDFLLGKQLPYVAIGMVNFLILTAMALVVFGIPIKGSAPMLAVCAFAYVVVTTSLGLLVSSFTTSQVAAVFVTTILTMVPTMQFSGMLQPVSTLQGSARIVGSLWPTTYYMRSSVGAFTKGLGAGALAVEAAAIAAFIPVLLLVAASLLRRQEP